MNNNYQGMLVCAVLGAAVGAAVGAGIALLYAPCSGRETRELLTRKVESFKNRASAAVEQRQQPVATQTYRS